MTARRLVFAALLAGAAVFAAPRESSAQSSTCADCHVANPAAPARDHLSQWERSAHGRHNIGCEKCHGGDASTYDLLPAHRGLLGSGNPSSPVHRRNLSATCGSCHPGPFVQFQKSRHFELLAAGDDRVPTCATCHGSSGSDRPSPRVLEAACRDCHGPKSAAPRVERAEAARAMLEAVRDSRDLLEATRPFIDRAGGATRQAQLREAYRQAEVPLTEAAESIHQFVFDNLKERLMTARKRIEALMSELANP